jgi:hypothetical protein
MDETQAKQIREALSRHRADFRGVLWQPRRLAQTNTVALIMEVVKGLVSEVKGLPLDDLPTSSKLRRYQHDVTIAYEKVKRDRLYNQAEFFAQVGVVFNLASKVFEELARLERMGYFDPNIAQEN